MTRNDLATLLEAYLGPLASSGAFDSARPSLGAWGSDYDQQAAEMEAFVRPLWGIAPLLRGFPGRFDTTPFLNGIAAGTDPAHPDYWGDVGAQDQRMVEMAGIAYAWLLVPHETWDPLSDTAKARAADWMRRINDHPPSDNNWLFFRVLVNLALRHVGEDWSESTCRTALDRLETFHLGDGYYRDGTRHQIDWYVPMAFQFYGLLVATFAANAFPDHAGRFRQRAHAFAQSFQYWFADDGSAIPFGRSMTYRTAQSAFWAACAFVGEEVLPWGRIKGLLLRNLRWWSEQPTGHRDGILSIGYAYPNPLMSEGYNALGSPYWALKSFLVLGLPDDHPFWRAVEEPPEALPKGQIVAETGGFALRRCHGHAEMLTGGQDGRQHRCADAKYGGFAYSSAFAFSVPSDATQPERPAMSAMDSGLAVSRDGLAWLRRGRITESRLRDGMAWGRWSPDARLSIDTWIDFAGDGWHVRLHRIRSDDALDVAESGFAVDRTGLGPESWRTGTGAGMIATAALRSSIVSLRGDRSPELICTAPNTNLLHPRAAIPRLVGRVPAGEGWICTAVCGTLSPEDAAENPVLPASLLSLLEAAGIAIST